MSRTTSLLLLLILSALGFAQSADQVLLDSLQWRLVGPFRGGRSDATSGVPGQKDHFYMGTCGGGLWKTTDAGKSWQCVSDGFFRTGSVGAVEVSQSHPETVYVGMGETELRGNITHGDGVYRSDDGGKTWRHLGLAETEHIARVRIHPTNPEIAWVAALGPVYRESNDRGIYKTTDGGKTWKKTLFVDNRSGGADISIDAHDSDIIYATTWTAWRTPYSLNSGGPGSRIFKSTDGGDTWKDITESPGLPAGVLGKIGISVSPADSNRVYAIVEAKAGGLYRSNDAGKTWELVNDNANLTQRPWYYTRVYADPKDADGVWVLNVRYGRSKDGGKTWRYGVAGHSDHHDLWIDPNDPTRIAAASDGGVVISVDDGKSWTDQNYPTAQFYHVSTDNNIPYRILGAQQDNSSVRIFSRSFGSGITDEDWESTAGGESGYVVADPTNPDVVFGGNYSGSLDMRDHDKRLSTSVDPWPDNPMGHGAVDLVQRFQWTYPILFSPHDPDVLYTCSQFVLKSTDRGRSWVKISPDLTTDNESMQQSSGGPISKDNTGVEYYCTVFTLNESPLVANLLWAGTDDGLVHITQNGGKSWSNITPKGMPAYALCSMIDPSPHDPASAYLAVDNHENGDKKPYIYVTHDYGKTWSNRVAGIPDNVFVRAVREDPEVKGLLYAGTESGVYVSYNDGKSWQSLQANLPITPVHDLTIKEDDLVVATHGRSFWVLDDLGQVRSALKHDASTPFIVPSAPLDGIRFGRSGQAGTGDNPPSGIYVRFWLPEAAEKVTLRMLDQDGFEVASTEVDGKKGYSVASLNPRYPTFRRFEGMLFWAAGARPVAVPPGEYALELKVGDQTLKGTVMLVPDPRTGATADSLIARTKLSREIVAATTLANETLLKIRDIKEKSIKAAGDDAKLKADAEALNSKLTVLEDRIYQGKAEATQDLLNFPVRLNNKLASLLGFNESSDFGITKQAQEVFKMLKAELDDIVGKYQAIEKGDLASFNAKLKAAGKEVIVPTLPPPPTGFGGFGGFEEGEGGTEGEGGEGDRAA